MLDINLWEKSERPEKIRHMRELIKWKSWKENSAFLYWSLKLRKCRTFRNLHHWKLEGVISILFCLHGFVLVHGTLHGFLLALFCFSPNEVEQVTTRPYLCSCVDGDKRRLAMCSTFIWTNVYCLLFATCWLSCYWLLVNQCTFSILGWSLCSVKGNGWTCNEQTLPKVEVCGDLREAGEPPKKL